MTKLKDLNELTKNQKAIMGGMNFFKNFQGNNFADLFYKLVEIHHYTPCEAKLICNQIMCNYLQQFKVRMNHVDQIGGAN
jgi:CTP:phosphocholine cytidylyltransferase-like protein